jgi:hypothetical protein
VFSFNFRYQFIAGPISQYADAPLTTRRITMATMDLVTSAKPMTHRHRTLESLLNQVMLRWNLYVSSMSIQVREVCDVRAMSVALAC